MAFAQISKSKQAKQAPLKPACLRQSAPLSADFSSSQNVMMADCSSAVSRPAAAAHGLLVIQPDNSSERDADDAMRQMMRSPVIRLSSQITPLVGVSEVNSDVEEKVRNASGSGRVLPTGLKNFFQSRYRHDLSKVRVHTDPSAASSCQKLDAAAFTFGSDIFFNAGRFSPATATGFGLVAHEVAHVVQHRASGLSGRLIQRAPLPYHQLKWDDFKATPPPIPTATPSTSIEQAGLWSSFEVPTPVLTSATKDTKKTCKLNKPVGRKTTGTKFDGQGSVDPAQFDGAFQPYMDTDKSWLRDRYKDDGTAFCKTKITECERAFDTQAAQVRTNCENLVTKCEDHFKSSKAEIRLPLGERKITISNTNQCRPMIFDKCQKLDTSNSPVTGANVKAECKTTFFRQCLTDESTAKASLLLHEQGHFLITKVMADKARDDLKARAKTLTFTAAECGNDATEEALRQSFEQQKNELIQRGEDWRTLKNTVQAAYDSETTNGSVPGKQKNWETKINAQLKDYVLPAAQPAPTAVTPAQPPTTRTPSGTRDIPTPAPKK